IFGKFPVYWYDFFDSALIEERQMSALWPCISRPVIIGFRATGDGSLCHQKWPKRTVPNGTI
ncbi:MAG: hypothetical protein IKX55_05650, partial [Bacteroidaceae bacterium]|nr:hypothetical protein [Bacteroidaceae bacterium]